MDKEVSEIEVTDTEVLDWLEEQVVDVIYLDDGRIIDVRGDSVRKAISAFRITQEPKP